MRQGARANGTETNPLNLIRVMPAQERSIWCKLFSRRFSVAGKSKPEVDFFIAGSQRLKLR